MEKGFEFLFDSTKDIRESLFHEILDYLNRKLPNEDKETKEGVAYMLTDLICLQIEVKSGNKYVTPLYHSIEKSVSLFIESPLYFLEKCGADVKKYQEAYRENKQLLDLTELDWKDDRMNEVMKHLRTKIL